MLTLGDANKASSRVRGYWVAEALEKKGFSVEVTQGNTRISLVRAVLKILSKDIVIIQKLFSRDHLIFAKLAKILGKTVFFDIDDYPSRIDHPRTMQNFYKTIRTCDAVWTGNAELAHLVHEGGGKPIIFPTAIKLSNYMISGDVEQNKELCLGWVGNAEHYQDDLMSILKEPLIQLAKGAERLRFKVVGGSGGRRLKECFGDIEGLVYQQVEEVDWSEPGALSKVLSDVDIGLYPLLDNKFNKYKCGFKALEYMALGIPVVSSDVSVNREILENGVSGLLVKNSSEEWVSAIESLFDKEERNKLSRNGIERARHEYDVDVVTSKLCESLVQFDPA